MARDDSKRAACAEHLCHLAPCCRISSLLGNPTVFNKEPNLFTGLCEKDNRRRPGIFGKRNDDSAIWQRAKNPIGIANDPQRSLLADQTPDWESTLYRHGPFIKSIGRAWHKRKKKEADAGGLLKQRCSRPFYTRMVQDILRIPFQFGRRPNSSVRQALPALFCIRSTLYAPAGFRVTRLPGSPTKCFAYRLWPPRRPFWLTPRH